MKVSAEVEIACSLAQSEASRRRHDLITVEHLLYALLHDDATARVVRGAGGNVDRLKKEIDRVLEADLTKVPGADPVTPAPSRGFQRVLQRAAIHVQSSGKEELKGFNEQVDAAMAKAMQQVGQPSKEKGQRSDAKRGAGAANEAAPADATKPD